jgi:hypothetical protein
VIQSSDFGDLVWVKVWDCRNWIKRDPFMPPKDFGKEQIRGINWDAFLGKAKKVPFDPVRYWAWRWYWDYAGGLLTDIGAHQLDIVQWLGGVDAPRSVTANGGVYHFKHWEIKSRLCSTLNRSRHAYRRSPRSSRPHRRQRLPGPSRRRPRSLAAV